MGEPLIIEDKKIYPGENKIIDLQIARLTSGTWIDMPVYAYRSKKPGPVLLFMGGLHGDEVNGVEIVRRLIVEKTLEKLNVGSVLAIPILNVFGFLNFSRDVTDGKDVNRSFPGSASGSLASRVAYRFTNDILPVIDVGIDFHTGGGRRTNYPQVRYWPEDKKAEEMAQAFGVKYLLHSKLIPKSFRYQAAKMKKPIVVYEGGESLRFDELAIEEGIKGAKRVLHHFNMKEEYILPETEKLLFSKSSWIRAKRSGMFRLFARSGEKVSRNKLLGIINDPYNQYEIKVYAHKSGHIIGHNNSPVVYQGDPLFHIGLL